MRRFDDDELAPWHRAMLAGAHEAGLPRVADPNAADAVSCAATNPVNLHAATRWNASFAYLDSARRRSNLTIADHAVADRVHLLGGRAVAVTIHRHGQELRIEAGTVVLACGAYGSPLVLQRSGIGPAADLRALGIAVAADLPVGRGPRRPPRRGRVVGADRRAARGDRRVRGRAAAVHGPGDGEGAVRRPARPTTGTSSSSPRATRPPSRAATRRARPSSR